MTEIHPAVMTADRGAQDQVRLPLKVAVRVSVQGIRTRLGRSVITLLGVALGIAFLLSVLTGMLIKSALADRLEVGRRVDRQVNLVRSEVGRLEGKSLAVVVARPEAEADRFVAALRAAGADVRVTAADAGAATAPDVSAAILLGGGGPWPGSWRPIRLDGRAPWLVFEPPGAALSAALSEAGVSATVLTLPLRPEEKRAAEQRAADARARTYWLILASLLITVIGIANAMLMSVTERVREIGTLKCLGALSGFVVRLFLIESAVIGLAGAVVGSVGGALFAIAVYGVREGFGPVLASMDYRLLLGAVAVGVITGAALAMAAAVYPARVAAKMIPAAALTSNV